MNMPHTSMSMPAAVPGVAAHGRGLITTIITIITGKPGASG
jgi:hypothetical protein